MQKNIFQDMVKVNQTRRQPMREVKQRAEPDQVEDYHSSFEERLSGGTGKKKNSLWIVALVAVIFFLFALSYLFSRAQVVIDPKVKDINLDQTLSASLNAGDENLPFDIVSIDGEESTTVTATEKKNVLQNARGAVMIYNKFSTAPQRLDIDTRLEGSNGKIYKTEKALTVPGMTGTTPGSVEVRVYGAQGGEAYNSGPLDFKIFGFKGTPKYDKFYGRSKGDLVGGFTGSSFVISLEEKAKTVEDLKGALQAKLFKKATSQIPDGFVLLLNAVNLVLGDTEGDSPTSPDNNILTFTQKGTLFGILLEEKSLTKKIAEKNIESYEGDGSDVYLANLKDLNFTLLNKDTPFKDLKNIDFKLSGSAKMVWRVSIDKLLIALVGKPKKDFNQILLQYPNISSANLSLSPIWNRTIPDKANDIKIIVNYP